MKNHVLDANERNEKGPQSYVISFIFSPSTRNFRAPGFPFGVRESLEQKKGGHCRTYSKKIFATSIKTVKFNVR